MHSCPVTATALIEMMKTADAIAQKASNAATRRAATELRDEAFRKFIWG